MLFRGNTKFNLLCIIYHPLLFNIYNSSLISLFILFLEWMYLMTSLGHQLITPAIGGPWPEILGGHKVTAKIFWGAPPLEMLLFLACPIDNSKILGTCPPPPQVKPVKWGSTCPPPNVWTDRLWPRPLNDLGSLDPELICYKSIFVI